MRAIKSWLSLLAAVVALLVANPGFASVAGASEHSVVTAATPSHCANMLGDHAPVGGKRAGPCEHCLLCGVAFIASAEPPTLARFAAPRRVAPLAFESIARVHDRTGGPRARASPKA